MLELVGLGGYGARATTQLSGGQQQRVALARSLVLEPKILLLDEPFASLDQHLRERLREEVRDIQQRLKITTLFVTHGQDEALSMADRIVVMRDGKIEQAGTPDELYADPDNLFVAGFIGSPRMNFLRAALTQGGIKLAAGPTLTVSGLPASGEVLVGVRPEHFVLEGTDAGVPITVDVVENLGGTRYLYGSTASGENVVVEVRDRPGIKAGDVVPVGINPARHMVFRATGERLRPGH